MTLAASAVLLVEDDVQLAGLVRELLESEGHVVDVAHDGQQALHLGLTRTYDVIVLDRGLPAVEGLDLLDRWRSRGVQAPVLVLSALSQPRDRVEGLDAGAEDYLGKPFDVDELVARVRALLRRPGDLATRLPVPGGWLEVESRTVTGAETEVPLSGREAALLEVLARQPRRVFTRRDLLTLVFERAEDTNAVDTYVHYLRRKLGRDVIATVHGLGYRLGSTR